VIELTCEEGATSAPTAAQTAEPPLCQTISFENEGAVDLKLKLQPGEVNGKDWFSGDGYSLLWQRTCLRVSFSGCEDIQSSEMKEYSL